MTHQPTRLEQVRIRMNELGLDAFLITHLPHVRYLTGFSGSNGTILLTHTSVYFFTDGRYSEQIKTELTPLPNLQTFIERNVAKSITDNSLLSGCTQLGFQSNYVSYSQFQSFQKEFSTLQLKETLGVCENIFMIKTPEEVALIRKAADIAAQVYEYILGWVRPGMKETDVAAEISYQGKKFGSEGDAFDIIVASGVRGALPHGHASSKVLETGELVTLDFGCIVGGFNSDMTRTFALGTPKDFDRKIFDIVLKAEQAGVQAAKAGMTGKELDAVTRDIISAEGFGEYFIHSTGHGLGIEVHEGPGISHLSEKSILPSGAVITIEPGIYIPNSCGVRIEDDVWLNETGCEVLTSSPRELIIV